MDLSAVDAGTRPTRSVHTMPIDRAPYLDPTTCAVVNMECQENLIGPTSVLPSLARSAAEGELVEHLSGSFDAARRVGTMIYYCTDDRRADGWRRPSRRGCVGERIRAYRVAGVTSLRLEPTGRTPPRPGQILRSGGDRSGRGSARRLGRPAGPSVRPSGGRRFGDRLVCPRGAGRSGRTSPGMGTSG